MYGLVLSAVRDLIIKTYSLKKWKKICALGKTPEEFQLGQTYDDKMLYDIVVNASKVLSLELNEVIESAGYWFVVFIIETKYGAMLSVLGSTLPEILTNINSLHSHLLKVEYFPDIKSPTFRTSHIESNSCRLAYTPSLKTRVGLVPLVIGIIKGLSELVVKVSNLEVQVLSTNEATNTTTLSIKWEDGSEPQTTRESSFTEDGSGIGQPKSTHGLKPKHLGRLFPFHIVFDEDLQVLQVGPSVRKIIPGCQKGSKLTSCFSLVSPAYIPLTWKELKRHSAREQIELKSISLANSMKETTNNRCLSLIGEIIFCKETKTMIFVGTPKIQSVQHAQSLGISLSDFALHDQSRTLWMFTSKEERDRENTLQNRDVRDVASSPDWRSSSDDSIATTKKKRSSKFMHILRKRAKDGDGVKASLENIPASPTMGGPGSPIKRPDFTKVDEKMLEENLICPIPGNHKHNLNLAERFSVFRNSEKVEKPKHKRSNSSESSPDVGMASGRGRKPLPTGVVGNPSIDFGTETSGSLIDHNSDVVAIIPNSDRITVGFVEMLIQDYWYSFPLVTGLLEAGSNNGESKEPKLENEDWGDENTQDLLQSIIDFYKHYDKDDHLFKYFFAKEITETKQPENLFRSESVATRSFLLLMKNNDECRRYLGKMVNLIWDQVKIEVEADIKTEQSSSSPKLAKSGSLSTNMGSLFEVNPDRLNGDEVTLAKNTVRVMRILESVFNKIVSTDDLTPNKIRRILKGVSDGVEKKYPDMKLKSIASLVFFRVLTPMLFSLAPTTSNLALDAVVRKIVLLVFKLTLNLINGVDFGEKEKHLSAFSSFNSEENRSKVNEWLQHLCTPNNEPSPSARAVSQPFPSTSLKTIQVEMLKNMDEMWKRSEKHLEMLNSFKKLFAVSVCCVHI
eukprot:TRINITY_DN19027_c0_g1_i1.p1 TRINITY_DN19027_c0_g1~~TRINITY_DN19027_c0_g1_i1.p1  ORF type:complete len:906 (+),score=132.32 TRINITY_DN19027_c0_g1_i1:56-2773(+)